MYNITEKETQPNTYVHINGSIEDILDRYCVSELCKGWPVYRDASEWNNYRNIFAENGAFVFTSTSSLPVDPQPPLTLSASFSMVRRPLHRRLHRSFQTRPR